MFDGTRMVGTTWQHFKKKCVNTRTRHTQAVFKSLAFVLFLIPVVICGLE